MTEDSGKFMTALKDKNLTAIREVPKADLHNHFVLGGNRAYIYEQKRILIEPVKKPLASMKEMDGWNNRYIGGRFPGSNMRKFLIEATFVQAKYDGITILEIGEDVWGLNEFYHNDIVELIETFQEINERIAPEISLRLQIGLSRHCPVDYLEDCLKQFWGHPEFYSIDLYGDELTQSIENFVPIYRRAKEEGLRLKAHIGEWGTAKDVVCGVEALQLDEVQHGIAAVESEEAIQFLKGKGIRLNLTPSSNLLLGRIKEMAHHPIQRLYRSGLDVTINSDDVLIFDSDVSKEYIRLFETGCLNAEELDHIRLNGLREIKAEVLHLYSQLQ